MPLLHDRFPQLRRSLPYIELGSSPTPVRRLDLSSDGHAAVWLKDDSRYGNGGWGGNKVRKLEWLIPDAQRLGKGTILTFGGLGTNWGLAAALYGREHGLHTALALVDQPMDDHVQAQLERLRRSGASLHLTHTKARTIARLPLLLARHRAGRHLPYLLPAGGSSPVGTLGYVEAALELAAQVRDGALPEPAYVVTATSTGGTASGLALGLRLAGLGTRVVAVIVNDQLRLDQATLLRLSRRAGDLLRRRGADVPSVEVTAEDLVVVREWLGSGYGHPTPEGERAQALAAEAGQLALDPVYTAKALAALMGMDAQHRFNGRPILFLNTYGPR